MKSEINNLKHKNLINLTFSEKFNTYLNIKDEAKILIIFFFSPGDFCFLLRN